MVRTRTTIVIDKERKLIGKRLLKQEGLNLSIFVDQMLKDFIEEKKEEQKNENFQEKERRV